MSNFFSNFDKSLIFKDNLGESCDGIFRNFARKERHLETDTVNQDNKEKQFLSAVEAPGTLEALVSQALAVVAAEHRDEAEADTHPVTVALAHAALSDEPEDRAYFISDLMSAGVELEDMIHNYAAQAARHLGKLWENNEISFVDVTIGTARLQETVRKLAGRVTRRSLATRRPEILLIVPKEEDHVFGFMVAAAKFEALGCRVCLTVGEPLSKIVDIYRSQSFEMVGISLSSTRNISYVRSLVSALKKGPRHTPVVLGGSLLETGDRDLKSETGADHVTVDAKNALRLCNVELPSQVTTREATTTMDETSSEGDVA